MIEHIDRHQFWAGDCRDLLRSLPDNSVDAVVTDPPYGLSKPPPILEVLRAWLLKATYRHSAGFMGNAWDSLVPGPAIWSEVARVLKPGGYALVAAGTRTVDLMGIALRLSGLEIRDTVHWCYWSGFPKSLDISKAIDADRGLVREVCGESATTRPRLDRRHLESQSLRNGWKGEIGPSGRLLLTAPACEESARYSGWGTGLKPAVEPFLVARKPLEGTYVETIRKWGTGAINVDGCRFAYGDPMWPGPNDRESAEEKCRSVVGLGSNAGSVTYSGYQGVRENSFEPAGRFPANLIHVAKPSRAERERYCEGLPVTNRAGITGRAEGSAGINNPRAGLRRSGQIRNGHPTVKPIGLMRWLCRLVTPPGGLVLDPFLGSGTTAIAAHLEGFRAIGAEMTYPEIPRQRLINLTRQQSIAVVSSYSGPDLRVLDLPDVAAPIGEDCTGEQLGLLPGLANDG